MSLAGQGAVAIWHDIEPDARDAFYAWHGHEHMPERVGIPGFLRGRRYVAIDGAPEYFNLYETATRAVLTGPDYLARLNDPTPWTAATVKHFRNVSRSLCEVAASFGDGEGGLIATLRYDIADAGAAEHRSQMERGALRTLAGQPGIAACHLLVGDMAASSVETAERKARADVTLVPRWIVLVEGWGDVDPFRAECERFMGSEAFEHVVLAPDMSIYRLQNSRSKLASDR